MAARDHVAQMLCHPLPTKGMDNAHDFHEKSNVGPNPKVPLHIAIPRSCYGDHFGFPTEMKKACYAQKFAKDGSGAIHPQWSGFQRNSNYDWDEQMVQFKHIVRH